jgi:hypothetical protein
MKGMRIACVMALLVAMTPAAWPAQSEDDRHDRGGEKFEDVVQIKLPKEYTFTTTEAAKGIKIPFEIVVLEDWNDVVPLPPGPSYNTPSGPSGLFPCLRIDGKNQLYAPLDFGLGAPPKEKATTIKKGIYKDTFAWDGRNWTGPSDFGNPKGKPFPPGEYKITISVAGKLKTKNATRPYTISGTARLVLK